MSAVYQPTLSPEEMHREQLLDYCKSVIDDMKNSTELRRAAFALMAQLIRERPAERVREIELERGLARC